MTLLDSVDRPKGMIEDDHSYDSFGLIIIRKRDRVRTAKAKLVMSPIKSLSEMNQEGPCNIQFTTFFIATFSRERLVPVCCC